MRSVITGSIAVLFAVPLAAQDAGRITTLTLDEAITSARRNNPSYVSALNSRRRASIDVRRAYTSFLPTIGSSMGFSWREGKPIIIEGVPLGTSPDIWSSSYGINASVSYSLQSLLGPKQANAGAAQAQASVTQTEHTLRGQITQLYLTVLERDRSAILQDSLVNTARAQLSLAQAKEGVGSGTPLETRRAQVAVGQAELAALNAHNAVEQARIQLFQQMGITPPGEVRLTTELPLTEPTFRLDDLLADARNRNATLAASRASERSAEINKAVQRGQYVPSLSFSSTLFSGNSSNAPGDDSWPFNYEKGAFFYGFGLSLPLWNYGREVSVQNAAITLSDRQQDVRRTELQVQADVTTQYKQLLIDWRTIALQESIADNARLALQLAQERYRQGAAVYLDVSTALDQYQQAENARVSSIYRYHRTFSALELAVGRPLR